MASGAAHRCHRILEWSAPEAINLSLSPSSILLPVCHDYFDEFLLVLSLLTVSVDMPASEDRHIATLEKTGQVRQPARLPLSIIKNIV